MTPPLAGPGGIVAWLVLLAVWLASAAVSGLLLALVARKVHPGLSFVRLWIFYGVLTGFLVAVVLLVGLF